MILRAILVLILAVPGAAGAQERRPSHCVAIADAAPDMTFVQLASFREDPATHSVRISYLNHAMFLIQARGGLSAVTDYTGVLGTADFTPTVATMNNAHGTHWTPAPDPNIPHVLEGWSEEGLPRDYHLDLGDMLVRNVHTNVRSEYTGVRIDGNSIFIFEAEGLCIGHLGHLHHYPSETQMAAIGRLDVVMAAVDGGTTLDLPTMIRLLKRLKSSIVIPMHWFSYSTLEQFLLGMTDEFAIQRDMPETIEVSLRTLPDRPTVVVLAPMFLQD